MSFAYDGNGNLTSLTDALGHATTYTYDAMDPLVTRRDALLRQESSGYDAAGNLTSLTDRKGQATSFQYDALGRRTQAAFAGSGGTISRSYDPLDRLTSETQPNGTVSSSYDAAGRRTSLTVAGQPPGRLRLRRLRPPPLQDRQRLHHQLPLRRLERRPRDSPRGSPSGHRTAHGECAWGL
jgi:YD repeat-containing protein